MSDEVKVLHQWADTDMTLRLVDDPLRVEGIDMEDPDDEWTADETLHRFYGLREIARLASLVAERDRELAAAKERIGKLEGELRDERRGPCGLSAGFER